MIKRIRTLVLLIFAVIFLTQGSLATSAAAANQVQEARNGVVMVLCIYDTAYGEDGSMGTGFFVGDGKGGVQYVLTNRHVVDPTMKATCRLRICILACLLKIRYTTWLRRPCPMIMIWRS